MAGDRLPYGRPRQADQNLDERRRSDVSVRRWVLGLPHTKDFIPTAWELALVDTTARALTATLPPAQYVIGARVRVQKYAGANYVKIVAAPGGSILGGTAYIWRTGDAIEFQAAQDTWVLLSPRPQLVDYAGQLDIVNTAAETVLYTVTIPGGVLSTARGVRFHIAGDYFNNSGAGRTLQLRFLYDDTAMYDDTTASITAAALRTGFNINCILGAQGSASAQTLTGDIRIGARTATVAGVGGLDTSTINVDCPFYGSAAENSDTDLTFQITATHAVADANLSLRRQYAFTEVLW